MRADPPRILGPDGRGARRAARSRLGHTAPLTVTVRDLALLRDPADFSALVARALADVPTSSAHLDESDAEADTDQDADTLRTFGDRPMVALVAAAALGTF